MQKPGFVLYTNYYDVLSGLNNEDLGLITRAIFIYKKDDEVIELPERLKLAFMFIKNQLDRDNDKYNKKVERMKENAKRNKSIRNETNREERKQIGGDNVNDNVNDNVCTNVHTKERKENTSYFLKERNFSAESTITYPALNTKENTPLAEGYCSSGTETQESADGVRCQKNTKIYSAAVKRSREVLQRAAKRYRPAKICRFLRSPRVDDEQN